ncbi:hypothetical protein [Pontibacter diazotrophicus]|nr:hypothetical protein [Pontibacter diazotrophicus]
MSKITDSFALRTKYQLPTLVATMPFSALLVSTMVKDIPYASQTLSVA